MIPIQEIDIYSDNGIKTSAHVVVPSPQNTISGVEVVVYDPNWNSLYSAYQTIGQHADPQAACQAIIDFSKKYIEKSGGKVIRINNPCNTEFVDAQDQQNIVNTLSLNLTVEVGA
ncbi:hypothetical protein [Litchfieldella rifensis]|uniref:Uncharacterized protein n=1 Tax=Litchfieldella rifensis TaxID=762643 RepID=A0ABV7LKI1_9GAMM